MAPTSAAQLWSSAEPATWEEVLSSSANTYSTHATAKLQDLNKWYEEELPATVAARDPPHMTQPELVKLVDWKLSHGKWRPNLLKFAQAQTDKDVTAASTEALQKLKCPVPTADSVKQALAALTKLKGVGPATASAVLAAANSSCPFMSDEALLAANKGSKDYTVPAYLSMLEALRSKARQLGTHPSGDAWTAVEVERCLYTAALSAKPPAEAAAAGKSTGAASKPKSTPAAAAGSADVAKQQRKRATPAEPAEETDKAQQQQPKRPARQKSAA